MKRSLALIAAIVLAAATATTSQAHPAVPGASAAAPVHLTYMDWYAPAYPNLAGVVAGDVSGEFAGAVLKATAPDIHGRFQTTAVYIVVASDASKSFTVRAHGTQDNLAGRTCHGGHCAGGGKAVLDGRVVDGWMTGHHAHAEYKVVSCTQSPRGTCNQGTITIT